MEGCTIALTITAKSAMNAGMNQFVFVAYSNALSSLLLLLSCSLMFHRDSSPFATIYKSEEVKVSVPYIGSFSSRGPNPGLLTTPSNWIWIYFRCSIKSQPDIADFSGQSSHTKLLSLASEI